MGSGASQAKDKNTKEKYKEGEPTDPGAEGAEEKADDTERPKSPEEEEKKQVEDEKIVEVEQFEIKGKPYLRPFDIHHTMEEEMKHINKWFKKRTKPQVFEKLHKLEEDLFKQLEEPAKSDKTIKIGDSFPEFALIDQFGQLIRLRRLLRLGPVVVTFFQGQWSPTAVLWLHSLQATTHYLKRHEAQIVAVCPHPPKQLLLAAEALGLTMTLVCDVDCLFAETCGVKCTLPQGLVTAYEEVYKFSPELFQLDAGDPIHLPMNSTFVIGRNGKTFAKFVYSRFDSMPDWREVLKPVRILDMRFHAKNRAAAELKEDEEHKARLKAEKKKLKGRFEKKSS